MGVVVSKRFPRLYPEQERAYREVLEAPEKLVVLIGPPGSGKSAVNMLVAEEESPGVILCVTKQLMDQYVGDFQDDVAEVKGRVNYACKLARYRNAEIAGDLGICKGCDFKVDLTCPYFSAADHADNSDLVITNYAYYHFQRRFGEYLQNRKSIVMDEAHELDTTLLGLQDAVITRDQARRFLSLEPPFSKDAGAWRAWLSSVEVLRGDSSDVRKMNHAIQAAQLALDKPDNWLLGVDMEKVTMRPLWITPEFTYPMVKGASRIVLSSATVNEPEYLAGFFGEKEYRVIEMQSRFEAWRRPLIFVPIVKVRRGISDNELQTLVNAIDYILDTHKAEKGIVHTVSYELRDKILARTRHPERFLTHSSGNRHSVIEQFKRDPRPRVLISPSMTTGVNLPYDHCRFQVISKLPVPDLSDERVQVRKQQNKGVVDAEVASVFTQTYGRIMRAEDDFGVTYVLDKFAHWFFEGKKKLFPHYVHEAAQVGRL